MAQRKINEVHLERERFVVSLTFEAFETHTPDDLLGELKSLPHGVHVVSGGGSDAMTVELVPEDAAVFERTVPFATIEPDNGLELLSS